MKGEEKIKIKIKNKNKWLWKVVGKKKKKKKGGISWSCSFSSFSKCSLQDEVKEWQ